MDVVVWPAPGPSSYAEAAARYAELRASSLEDPAVVAFHRELLETCPDPGAPVAWDLTAGADAVIVHVVPESQRLVDLVTLLALKHGLACYVPSRREVMT